MLLGFTGVYEDAGPMAITGATNARPILITSPNHGLQTGESVVISGVKGNTAANGTWVVTRVNANEFSLNGSNGTASGGYLGGGTWIRSSGFVVPSNRVLLKSAIGEPNVSGLNAADRGFRSFSQLPFVLHFLGKRSHEGGLTDGG